MLCNYFNVSADYLLGLTKENRKTKKIEINPCEVGNRIKEIRSEQKPDPADLMWQNPMNQNHCRQKDEELPAIEGHLPSSSGSKNRSMPPIKANKPKTPLPEKWLPKAFPKPSQPRPRRRQKG